MLAPYNSWIKSLTNEVAGFFAGRAESNRDLSRRAGTSKVRQFLAEPLEGRCMLSAVLGTAADFAVLGASTVTNTGATDITGSVGVSPGSAITGFPPGTVSGGTIHANDSAATQAHADLATAYGNIAGEASLPANNLSGTDLGGLTLAPGVYHFNTSATLAGTLTLDAQGDPNARFDFQIGTTFITSSASAVHVINGGSDDNVYFQVGTSATLGTNTLFEGNILADQSITLTTGASMGQGRALALVGAVTMDTNDIVGTQADVSITSTVPGASVRAGSTLTYTITVDNNGSSDAQSVALTDVIPTGTTFVSNAQTSGPAFSLTSPSSGGTGTISGSISTLAASASATFTVTVMVSPSAANGSMVINAPSVTAATSDPNLLNNSQTDTTNVLAAPVVTAVAPASGPAAGGTVVTITGTNLAGATSVLFGTTPVTVFTSDSSTQIVLTSPAGTAGTVDIDVVTSGGTSANSVADHYNYLAALQIQIDTSNVTFSNDVPHAIVTLDRSGSTAQSATVAYATADGTALSGIDYSATSGTATFLAGQSTTTISIPLLGNFAAAASTVFSLHLSNPTGGAVLALPASSNITVTNAHSIVQYDAPYNQFAENYGIITVTASRVGNISLPATLDFASANGTALAGKNYVATSGTLHYAAGQVTATFGVTYLEDYQVDPLLFANFSMTNPTGGMVLGRQQTLVLGIIDETLPPTISDAGINTPLAGSNILAPTSSLTLTFDQPLMAAPVASDFTLDQRSNEGANGTGKSTPRPLTSVTYNATTHQLVLLPTKPLKNNVFYQLTATATAAENLSGQTLGSAYVATFAKGRVLTYIDKDGNRVHLALRGPGIMQLTRTVNGQGESLSVLGVTAKTKLAGSVQKTHMGGDGTTTLADISGLDSTNLILHGITVTTA